MEKEFVPYELAVKLKAIGFDEPCFTFYSSKGVLQTGLLDIQRGYLPEDLDKGIMAPTFSQAFRWFRENYGLLHELISCAENSWLITIVDMNSKSVNGVYMKRTNLDDRDENIPETYEEAELACLERLIDKITNKKIFDFVTDL